MEKFKINDNVWLALWSHTIMVTIVGIRETLNGKVKYDVSVNGRSGGSVRMYNINSDHFHRTLPEKIQVDTPIDKCPHCNVPAKNHGTCCGWQNASADVNLDSVVIDPNHPAFGRKLHDWKRNYIANLVIG